MTIFSALPRHLAFQLMRYDYGCSEEEIEEMLYDPTLLHEMTGELLYAY